MGFPEVEDPCSKAKGRRAGSRRETDGRLMRVIFSHPFVGRAMLGFPWGKLAHAVKRTGD